VERFITQKYANEHKIVTEIAFQYARAYQQILSNPLDTEVNYMALHNALDCNEYFSFYAQYLGDSVLIKTYIAKDFKDKVLNRKSRLKAYLEYDKQLSGGVYESTKIEKLKERCDFDVSSLLGSK